jgi:hypothetical protein
MNYEGLKYIFDTYSALDKVLICPDGEIFFTQNQHLAKSYCREQKLKEEDIKEYTRTAFNQDYQPEPEKPNTEPTTEKTAKK